MSRRLVALAAFLLAAHAAAAQTPADSLAADSASVPVVVEQAAEAATAVADEIEGLKIRPILNTGALYSGSRGFGIGGGVAVSNLALRGDHSQVEARVTQHLQGIFGSYQTGTPERSPLYALVGASFVTSPHFPFVGRSPQSDPNGQLYLDRTEAEVEGRIAWQPAGVGGPLVQPFVRYRTDRLRGSSVRTQATADLVTAADRAAIDALTGQTRTGVYVGLGLQNDARDNEARPTRGTYAQVSASRFFSTDGSGLQFTHGEALGYAFRPAPFLLPFQTERGSVFVRVSGTVTRPNSSDALPIFYLPVLNRDLFVGWPEKSFTGRDALSVGVGARSVLVPHLSAFRVEGLLVGMLGAAYDDVFSQFSPRVSRVSAPVAAGANVPLRPSLGIGVNLHYRDKERPLVGGLIGIGPGGITTTEFRLVIGLDRYLPSLR